jgi:ribosomal protein S12 methylthiotransferase
MGPRPAGPPRVYLHTLGCPKNEADSRSVRRALAEQGVAVVDEPEQASHILLNTCGFIREAKEESIGAILEATSEYPHKQILVMGCLVERYRDELAAGIPEVAQWFGLVGGPDEQRLVGLLADADPGAGGRRVPAESPRTGADEQGRDTPPLSAYAYVKISDGCDELCTFCAIPGIKGPYHAASPEEILRDAAACLSEGAKELVLVGQDTARWSSGGLALGDLADMLTADPRLEWLRIMYLQPEHVSEDFLGHMGLHEKLCHYLDVPLQHSHPDVLRRMGRAGDGESYLRLLDRARRMVPDVALRSTFIVGFPGETEAHFEHLLDFVRAAEFDYAGGFIYSPEEGTPAARLKPRVPSRVARERLNGLNQVIQEVAESLHARQVGSRVDVMVDLLGTDVAGRTRGQAPEVDGVVHIEGALPVGTKVGDVIGVTIEAAVGYDFVGTCDEL